MKAFIITKPNKFELVEVKKPTPDHDEVLVKVTAAGLCGTDIHILKGDHPTTFPIIPGHEFAGIVDEVGTLVKGFKKGDAVIVDPNIFCESCYYCKQNKQIHCENIKVLGSTMDGAFAEYVAVPQRCLFHIGDIPAVQASMAEPLACVINAYNKVPVPLGGHVLIYGAGTIGLMHLMISLRSGAASVTVVDKKQASLKIAAALGATYVLESDEQLANKLNDISPRGFTYVIDATGVPSVVEQAITYLAKTGTFIAFGACPSESTITINPFDLFYNDWKLIGSYALEKTMQQSIDMLTVGGMDLSPLIGQVITLDEMPDVFPAFCDGETNNKIIVKFS